MWQRRDVAALTAVSYVPPPLPLSTSLSLSLSLHESACNMLHRATQNLRMLSSILRRF